MNTLDELLYYCRENEPVGALLLTGEWGCGKTYLIDHTLKEKLKDEAKVLRISLFGISAIEDIHVAVKQAWISEYNKGKKYSEVKKKIWEGKEKLAKVEFLPDWLKGVMTTEWIAFVEIKRKIDEKLVVLVFDDLERCCLDTIEVLGAINEYCENQRFHTIIVANQDKINTTNEFQNIPIEAEMESYENGNDLIKRTVAKIKMKSKKDSDELTYNEIKEKIIHRTVQYIPDYTAIVQAVVEKMEYQEDGYKDFVKECIDGILELFAPDRNTYNESQKSKRPHNIRSLKCAIRDFYRIYGLLKNNGFEDIDKWFYSFISYVVSYKANIAKEGHYGTLFSDRDIKELYPAFQSKYIFTTVKNWILHGVWDEEMLVYELGLVKAIERAETPADIVRTYKIMDIDEDVILEGFPGVVEMAYAGTLNLDEYVHFIQNNCWARFYNFELPVSVDWNRVQEGVNTLIKSLLESRKEGQQLHSIISADNKEFFTKEEWVTYQTIEEVKNGNILMFSNNKKLYVEGVQKDMVHVFATCQNKRFNIFDEEMAIATAEAYAKGSNSEKHQFVGCFNDMWESNVISQDIRGEESFAGFCKLQELLEIQKETLQKEGKAFAIRHTEDFIKYIDGLKRKLRECSGF